MTGGWGKVGGEEVEGMVGCAHLCDPVIVGDVQAGWRLT